MPSRTKAQELLAGKGSLGRLMGGRQTGVGGTPGHPLPGVELCDPTVPSASTALPAAVSLETGAGAEAGGRKGIASLQERQAAEPGSNSCWRGDGWKAMAPLLPEGIPAAPCCSTSPTASGSGILSVLTQSHPGW